MALSKDDLFAFVKRNPIGVGCLVISLGIGGALYFRWGKILELQAERDAKDIQSRTLSKNKEAANHLKEQLDRITEDNKSVDSRLLAMSRGGTAFLSYFYRLSDDVPGIKNLSVVAQPVSAGRAGLGSVSYTLNVQGTYPQMLNVLRRLESGSYFCRILNLKVATATGSDAGPDGLAMQVNLELLGQQ